ncbi:MAG: VIT and vWA domain-containing protein, partial [Candidatus Hinthialibacter sp.]
LIVVDPDQRTSQGISLPIRSHEVKIQIREQTAVTTIEQEFFNPHNRQVEGTYVLAIPERAGVSDFRMEMNGEPVQGELLDKDKAEKIYQDIVRKMKDPGILSFHGRGMIRARIFPIEPNSTQKIRIRYEEILNYDRGVCRYVYALATDKLSKKTTDFVRISANIFSNTPLRNIYSPSHEIDVQRKNNFEATAKYSDENVIPDQDFELIFSVDHDDVGMNLLTYKEKGEDGFFLLMAAPKVVQEGEAVPKDVIFVLDKSGSMKGNNKIKQAKEALEFCVRSLNPDDRFAVVTFSDEIEPLTKLTEASSKEIDQVCEEIQKIDANGGTNIDGALKTAFDLVPDSQRPIYVLFLTDGLPTVGVRDVGEILKHVKNWNQQKCRMFAFGVGYDVNTTLLDQLSQTNKGLATYVKPSEDIEISVSSMYSKIANPALADLQLDFGGVEVKKMYPKELPDLFSGSQLIVIGRYEEGDSTMVTLSGKAAGETKKFKEEFSFARHDTNNEFIPRLWAARRIGYLMNEIRMNGKNDELVQEIVALSQKYGILTEYTSFLVTEAPVAAEPIAREERERMELRSMDRAGRLFSLGMSQSVGKDAVAQSEVMQDQLQNAPALSSQNVYYRYDASDKKQIERIQGVRYAGQQAFFHREDQWISTQYDANQSVIQVKPYSEAYFQLAELSPDVSKILALAPKVSFVRNNVMIQIDENGLEKLSREQIEQLK